MFYVFRQNNSGGVFHLDSEVAKYVYIEADSADAANERAVEVGIYFNGVACETDCGCCGDRWSAVHDFDHYRVEVPADDLDTGDLYDIDGPADPVAHVYHADGRHDVITRSDVLHRATHTPTTARFTGR